MGDQFLYCRETPEYPRDTFAGKMFSDFWRAKYISEKWSEFYRQKCRAGVRTKLLFLVMMCISRGFPRRIIVVVRH
jgi:hypothetical protein